MMMMRMISINTLMIVMMTMECFSMKNLSRSLLRFADEPVDGDIPEDLKNDSDNNGKSDMGSVAEENTKSNDKAEEKGK
jgi:hypothetical protein